MQSGTPRTVKKSGFSGAGDSPAPRPLAGEGNSEPGGVDPVVGLTAWDGIAQEAVAEREIPGKPFLHLGGYAEIGIDTVVARAGKIVKHAKGLDQRSRAGQLEVVFVPPERFRRVPGQRSAETRMIVIGAAQEPQSGVLAFHGLVSETASDNKSQVQVLELVVFPIVKDIHKQAWAHVVVVFDPGVDRLGGAGGYAVDQSRSLDQIEADGGLVVIGLPRGVGARRERGCLGIAFRTGPTQAAAARPKLKQARMQQPLIGLLFVGVAYGGEIGRTYIQLCIGGRDFLLPLAGSHRT